jgi:hypothetical protein
LPGKTARLFTYSRAARRSVGYPTAPRVFSDAQSSL